jgi:hypothetical protein
MGVTNGRQTCHNAQDNRRDVARGFRLNYLTHPDPCNHAMNERERWIVYPLLFLALGAGLRDKLSEQTKTKRIECQELIVFGEEGANRQPVSLVQIGAMPRSNGNSPQIGQLLINGQLLVNGQLVAQGIQTDSIQASNVNADNYYFRRVPFAPALLRAMPGVSPADWLRALQQSAQSPAADSPPDATPAEPDDAPASPPVPPAK